jgi:hypothetical protein
MTASHGAGRCPENIAPNQHIRTCLLVSLPSWASKNFGKPKRQTSVGSLFGWHSSDRCWMAQRILRHGLRSEDTCLLCNQDSETVDHLLCQCVFGREIWLKSLRRPGWHLLSPTQVDTFTDWWLWVHKRVPKSHRMAFDSYIILIACGIWRERNGHMFSNIISTPVKALESVSDQSELWCQAGICSRSQMFAM